MTCNLSKDCLCTNTIQENYQLYLQLCHWIKQLAIFQLGCGASCNTITAIVMSSNIRWEKCDRALVMHGAASKNIMKQKMLSFGIYSRWLTGVPPTTGQRGRARHWCECNTTPQLPHLISWGWIVTVGHAVLWLNTQVKFQRQEHLENKVEPRKTKLKCRGFYALGKLLNPATLQKGTVPVETSKDSISCLSKKREIKFKKKKIRGYTPIQKCWEKRYSKEFKTH